jgi:two-component system, chemotaxis family, sensor kinase CheA
MLAAEQNAHSPTTPPTTGTQNHNEILEDSVDTLLNGQSSEKLTTPQANANSQEDSASRITKLWRINFRPEPQILLTGNEPLRLFRELNGFGELNVVADVSNVPVFAQLTADECFIHWTLDLQTDVSEEDILEVFDWVIDECQLDIQCLSEQDNNADSEQEIESTQPEPVDNTVKLISPAKLINPAMSESEPTTVTSEPAKPTVAKESSQNTTTQTSANTSIRVSIDKVDSLINLVGELVITQSMLSELGNNFEMEKVERLSQGLEQLLQNTKELQESVMRIRMLPISFAFNRFPRMIRDLAAKTGKKMELKLNGEQTELDKTVMEQIGDPLVHLVRNAIDHGLEPAADRIAAGKTETGTVHLDAYHQGGNIVIEISDDGRGLNAEKILAKAREKGIIDAAAGLSEAQIFDLIFEPGFSTAEVVSDISGRGVGMDVVRRNIKQLGGRIEVESAKGKGSTFKIHLPLTLAILDGQLVRVGEETYIIPLIAIVESLQIKSDLVNKVTGNMQLYRLREDNVPIIPIYQEFGIEADNTELENGLLVVVEGDGQKIGLLVDDLLAQQQVVIKSLESNYKSVRGLSGATILGDGSVALILDVPGLITRASTRSRNSRRRNKAA